MSKIEGHGLFGTWTYTRDFWPQIGQTVVGADPDGCLWLLNYCGDKTFDVLEIADQAPSKIVRWTPIPPEPR